MRNNFTWILFLILPCVLVKSRPTNEREVASDRGAGAHVARTHDYDINNKPKQEATSNPGEEQVISVRITSSIAVGRGKGKLSKILEKNYDPAALPTTHVIETTSSSVHTEGTIEHTEETIEHTDMEVTDIPPSLEGANIEFIKQLTSRKEARGLKHLERVHLYPSDMRNEYSNETDDSIAESSIQTILQIAESNDEIDENIENVPLARSVPLSPSPKNYIQGLAHKPFSERRNNQRLTTVSFNIVHDAPKPTVDYSDNSETYTNPSTSLANPSNFHYEPPKFYNEPAKVYSQPAQIYSEPAKYYSEPAKIYSEPAKIYSEPAKVYSEPAKIYSEPAKFYSQPASLHLTPDVPPSRMPWHTQSSDVTSTIINTTPLSTDTHAHTTPGTRVSGQEPERNYEVDEKVSVLTDGQSHGIQDSTTESCKEENCKVGYVVEGRQYKKYRVEERTSDGFIVGEYGVVRNEDGALRGVRYTADSDASPRLIHDALMKFLQL